MLTEQRQCQVASLTYKAMQIMHTLTACALGVWPPTLVLQALQAGSMATYVSVDLVGMATSVYIAIPIQLSSCLPVQMLSNLKDALAVFDFVTCVRVEEINELPSA